MKPDKTAKKIKRLYEYIKTQRYMHVRDLTATGMPTNNLEMIEKWVARAKIEQCEQILSWIEELMEE